MIYWKLTQGAAGPAFRLLSDIQGEVAVHILLYTRNEYVQEPFAANLLSLGHRITLAPVPFARYDDDPDFQNAFFHALDRKKTETGTPFDFIFSFNYYPDIARVAQKAKVQYVSWIFDSPHLPLQSKTLGYPCNLVFVFDHFLYEKYRAEGYANVCYLPLPARIIEPKEGTRVYKHDITFLGSLYDGSRDLYGTIRQMSDYLRGYMDAAILAQRKVYNADILDELITSRLLCEFSAYINTELSDRYRNDGITLFRNVVRRRITMEERKDLLQKLGDRFSVALYSQNPYPSLPVQYMGYAEYVHVMPRVFQESKINLNITLRSIRSGIPLRIMDILGAGGFCLTNKQAELERYFRNGVDLVWYEDENDLLSKAEYYLHHEDEREQIARNGHARVRELFAYEKQLNRLLSIAAERKFV